MVWRNGLLIKLKKLGINGKMFSWIADFFTDRTIPRWFVIVKRLHIRHFY